MTTPPPTPAAVYTGVAVLVLVTMAAVGLFFYPGLIFRRELPRVGAYIAGLATILSGYAIYQGWYIGDWQAVWRLFGFVLAAAIPTVGLRIVARYAHLERAIKELNSGNN